MLRAACTILMLTALMSADVAFAGHDAHHLADPTRYVAKVTDDLTGPSGALPSTPPPSCSTDFDPADPIYFKLADGRCSGD